MNRSACRKSLFGTPAQLLRGEGRLFLPLSQFSRISDRQRRLSFLGKSPLLYASQASFCAAVRAGALKACSSTRGSRMYLRKSLQKAAYS